MQEKADAEIGSHFSQHAGNELQLIVVHPHGRVWLGDLRDAGGKGVIDSLVGAELVSVIYRWHNAASNRSDSVRTAPGKFRCALCGCARMQACI